jgi:hypothetical protein
MIHTSANVLGPFFLDSETVSFVRKAKIVDDGRPSV